VRSVRLKRSVAALLLLAVAASANPVRGDLTPGAILTTMMARYAHIGAYSDSGSVDTGESWGWTLWNLIRHGRTRDTFQTNYVRGRLLHFRYTTASGLTREGVSGAHLIEQAGTTHGVSSPVPLLLIGAQAGAIGRLTALRRAPDATVRGARCFTITGVVSGERVQAACRLQIDQRTYFLRRIQREIVARDDRRMETIDYFTKP